MKIIVFVVLFFQSLLSSCQNKAEPIFNRIPKEYFISGTPMDNSSLQIYTCTKCFFDIEYVRNVDAYKDYFVINKKTFNIKELLVMDRIEFYNVSYLNKKYLLILSPDFSSSGKAYSVYKNYYLFILDKQNQVISLKKVIDSKSEKKSVFLKLVK